MTTITDEVDWERSGEGGIIRTKTNEKSLTVRMTRTQQEKKKPMSKTLDNEKQIQKRGKKKVG